jgi:hypothetical protein
MFPSGTHYEAIAGMKQISETTVNLADRTDATHNIL